MSKDDCMQDNCMQRRFAEKCREKFLCVCTLRCFDEPMNNLQRNARHLMAAILSLLAAATLLASAALPANAAAPKAPTLRRTISTGMSNAGNLLGGLQLSPDGRFVAADVYGVSEEKDPPKVLVADTRNGDQNSMTGYTVLFTANGTLAYIGDSDGRTVKIYDTVKHTVKDTIHRQVGDTLLEVSEDGDVLLFYNYDSKSDSTTCMTYRISTDTTATLDWDITTGGYPRDMHISKDGTTIYGTGGASDDSHLVAWDANTGKQLFSTRIPVKTQYGSFIQGFANKGRSLIISSAGIESGVHIVRYDIATKQFTKLTDNDGTRLAFNSQCSQFTYLQKDDNESTGSSPDAYEIKTEDTMSGKIIHSVKAPGALADPLSVRPDAYGLSSDGSILYYVSSTKAHGESGDGQKPAEHTSVLHAMNLADGSTSETQIPDQVSSWGTLSSDDSTLALTSDPATINKSLPIYVFDTHISHNPTASAVNNVLAASGPLLIGAAIGAVILVAAVIVLLLHRRRRARARVNYSAAAQPNQPIWSGTANQSYMANQPSQPSQTVQPNVQNQPTQPGIPNQPGAQSAPSASAPTAPTPKFCRHCGSPLTAQSAFCANCGKPVN
jgi:hypothetical protein